MKLISILLVTLFAIGCRADGEREAATGDAYQGMCDASAVVAVTDDLFLVGDDEDSVLRMYSRSQRGRAVQRLNVGSFLGFGPESEADLEGAARIGNHVFWITSHGNNRKGKEQESRQRFFATTVSTNGGVPQIRPAGTAYTGLLDDLLKQPALRSLELEASLNLPPKTPGALNIEGLAATPAGHLLIGFRNPVPQGRALIVPLLNPFEVISGTPPKFGPPLFIDLGGHGIRSLERWADRYLIVAGSIDGKGKSRLYEWSGEGSPTLLHTGALEGLNPEAISVIDFGGEPTLLVVSDDGTRKVNGVDCKQLADPDLKTFRAVVISLATLTKR